MKIKYGVGIFRTIQTPPVTEIAAETDENLEITVLTDNKCNTDGNVGVSVGKIVRCVKYPL